MLELIPPDENPPLDPEWLATALDHWDAAGLATLVGSTTEAVVVMAADGHITFSNPAGQRLLGHAPGSLLGSDAFGLVHEDDLASARAALSDAAGHVGATPRLRVRLRTGDDRWRNFELGSRNLTGDPRVRGLVVTLRDVTDHVRAEEAIRHHEELFHEMAEHAPDFIFRYRCGDVPGFEYASPRALDLTGRPPQAFYSDPTLIKLLLGTDHVRPGIAPSGHLGPVELEIHHPNGLRVWAHVRMTVHLGDDGTITALDGIVRDITERKIIEDDLAHRALRDPLTGLANRALFYDRLNQSLRRADRLPSSPAVLFLDLDRFKAVNDALGHAAGDHLLVEVAHRLTAAVRPSDTVARLGGDEFLVLCDDINDDLELKTICMRLRDAVRAPITIASQDITIGVSIGATRAAASATADELLHDADLAMYEDKHDHHTREPAMHSASNATDPRRRHSDDTTS